MNPSQIIDSSDLVKDLTIKLQRNYLENCNLQNLLDRAKLEQRFAFAKNLPAYVAQIPTKASDRNAIYICKLLSLNKEGTSMSPVWNTQEYKLLKSGECFLMGSFTDDFKSPGCILKPISAEDFARVENYAKAGSILWKKFLKKE